MELEKLRFPIGKYTPPAIITKDQLKKWIEEIEHFPEELKMVTGKATEEQLNTPYRPSGWTLKQVVHHVADSHMNSYIRFKLAVTEDNPVIKPYFEERWADFDEAKNGDIAVSLDLIKALHKRWGLFLRSMTDADWDKTFFHPESKKSTALSHVAGLYAWHGKHHLNHLLLVTGY